MPESIFAQDPFFLIEDRSSLVEDPFFLVEDPSSLVEDPSSLIEDRSSLIEVCSSLVGDRSYLIEDRSFLVWESSYLVEERFLLDDDPSFLDDDPSLLDQARPLIDDDRSSLAWERSFLVEGRLLLVEERLLPAHRELRSLAGTILRGPAFHSPAHDEGPANAGARACVEGMRRGKGGGAAARRDDWRTPKRTEGPMAKYVTVVLDIPPEEWKFSGYANSVLTKLTNNAHVPNPTPSLAVYGGHVTLLLKAEADVANGVPGAVKACAAAKEKVKEDLNHLRDSVQLAVEALVGGTDLKGIEAIIESTGMRLKKLTPRAKYDHHVAPGDADGSLMCTAPASPARDTNEWDYSTDRRPASPSAAPARRR